MSGRFKRFWPALAAVATMLLTAGACADSICLGRTAEAGGPRVRLAEVAELDGSLAVGLGQVVVAEVARDGNCSVELSWIRRLLDEKGVDWSRLSLVGQATCRVTAAAADDGPPSKQQPAEVVVAGLGTVGGEILRLLAQQEGVAESDLKVTFGAQDRGLIQRSLAAGRYELQPLARGVPGRVPVAVRRFQDGLVVETQHVRATVRQRFMAVVTTRAIGRRQAIEAADVQLGEVWLAEQGAAPLTEVGAAVGQVANSALRAGEVVTGESLQPAVMVKRSDPVTVYCSTGGLLIKLTATAMDEGTLGQTIRLRNDASRGMFWATVTGPRQVACTPQGGASGQERAEAAPRQAEAAEDST